MRIQLNDYEKVIDIFQITCSFSKKFSCLNWIGGCFDNSNKNDGAVEKFKEYWKITKHSYLELNKYFFI